MKKELKNYLHLYLGCELLSISTYEIVGKLEGIVGSEAHFKVNGVWYSASLSNYKPILRPLSDMTEDEVMEFINDVFKFKDQFRHRITKYKIDKGFLSFDYHNSNGGNGGGEHHVLLIKNWGKDGNGEWIFNCSYSMNDVVWLLKKSFDIFGLIESGLAIDASKVKSKI